MQNFEQCLHNFCKVICKKYCVGLTLKTLWKMLHGILFDFLDEKQSLMIFLAHFPLELCLSISLSPSFHPSPPLSLYLSSSAATVSINFMFQINLIFAITESYVHVHVHALNQLQYSMCAHVHVAKGSKN